MTKTFCLLNFISQEPCIISSWLMVHICKRMISPGVFFAFFPNFNFRGQQWRKSAKNGLKWQKIMSVWAFHIWVSIHYMIAFFIFLKFWFSRLLGGRGLKGQKTAQNNKKICFTSYLRNCTSYDCGFWYTYVKWYLWQIFSLFQKSDFFLVFQISSINTKRKFWGVPHLPHICVFFFVKLWLLLSQNITCILVRQVISLKYSVQRGINLSLKIYSPPPPRGQLPCENENFLTSS